ncbi:MAG TPA: PPC domain-containing protein, partial [Polyangiales bacterium]
LIQLPENPAESAESMNGALGGAEAVTLGGSRGRRGLVLSRLPAGDVDYYRFDLAAKDLVRVSCEAESAGSGVRGLSAEVRDANDQKLAGGAETALANLLTEPVEVPSAGTYYLRLSSATTEPLAIDPWVRCAVLINR